MEWDTVGFWSQAFKIRWPTFEALHYNVSSGRQGQGLIAIKISQRAREFSPKSRCFATEIWVESASRWKRNWEKNSIYSFQRASRPSFPSLHNNAPGNPYPLDSIAKTNALPLGADASEGGLFPEASWINYSCLPNKALLVFEWK